MAKPNYNTERSRIANRLRQTARVLLKYNICSDTSMLDQAASICVSSAPNCHSSHWGYNFDALTFDIGKPAGLYPQGIESVVVRLSVLVRGDFSRPSFDPFTTLEVNIENLGYTGGEICSRNTWHFDRHITEDGDGDDTAKESGEFHPLYHFQYGGRRLKENVENFGELLTMDAPRMLHPPLEGLLAIDFVLANFRKEAWNKVWLDGNYKNNAKPTYTEVWKPYLGGLFNFFDQPKSKHDNGLELLFPNTALTG